MRDGSVFVVICVVVVRLAAACGSETFTNAALDAEPADAASSDAPSDRSAPDVATTDAGRLFCEPGDSATYCQLGAEVCCYGKAGPNFCLTKGASCAGAPGGAYPIECLVDRDCKSLGLADQICCGIMIANDAYYQSVVCRRPDECLAPSRHLCTIQTECAVDQDCVEQNALIRACVPH